MDMDNKLLFRPNEAADAMGVSRSKCYELISAGDIPSVKVGGRVRVPVDALRAWIDQQITEQTEARGVSTGCVEDWVHSGSRMSSPSFDASQDRSPDVSVEPADTAHPTRPRGRRAIGKPR